MYAALHIPRFALQSALRTEEGLAAQPVALVDESESRPRVSDLTPAAESEGVVAGLLVGQALGRCPELQIRYRSEQAEWMAWQALFHEAYSIAPRVERVSAGLCLVDLRGVSLPGVQARCAEIVLELGAMGLKVSVGIAASSSLAMLAAKQSSGVLLVEDGAGEKEDPGASSEKRKEQERVARVSRLAFLDALPMDAAEPDEALAAILQQWGIRTVGGFARLSRQALGKRLGKSGLLLWDRVNGRDQRIVAVADLPPVFEESWRFEYEVDSLEPLLFLLRRFLDQLCLRLGVAHKVAAEATLTLKLAYGEPIERKQKMPEPTRDTDALFRLLSGRLEGLDTDSPVVEFSLRFEAIDSKQRQLGLFESSLKNPYRFTQTLARVAGIIGSERVGRPALESDGRPDGFRLEPLPSTVPPAGEACLNRHYALPLRRFRLGLKASVELQGRQPIWFKSEQAAGFVKACRGPWLHSGHWWEDEGGWNRVEWDVELRKGGMYRLVKENGQWFVEGEYG